MKQEIQDLENKIFELQNTLRIMKHSCEHKNAELYMGKSAGSYYDDPQKYVYIDCPDCGIKYTYYDDEKEFKKFYKED